jgi:hypothetical protein
MEDKAMQTRRGKEKLGCEQFAGCTISRVRECLHVGKTNVFSNLLEGETSMVRWHLNGLDLTRFHDLVGSS